MISKRMSCGILGRGLDLMVDGVKEDGSSCELRRSPSCSFMLANGERKDSPRGVTHAHGILIEEL
jgi:hypothetical protein